MESQATSKGRKIGRSARSPAHHRYNMEERWVTNKARKIAKQARLELKQRKRKELRLLVAADRTIKDVLIVGHERI